jgi:hypothetical protein
MIRSTGLLAAVALALPATGHAQTAYAGEVTCGKPTIEHRVSAESNPGHSFVLRQGLCHFTKAATVNGLLQVEETFTGTEEIDGGVAHWRGFNTTKMANGDRSFERLECTSKVAPDGTETAGACKFTMAGGTGKMKGISGGGNSKQTNRTDPASSWEFTGSYKIAP